MKYPVLENWCQAPDFLLAVSMGKIKGASYMRKFASLPDAPATTERDIWEYGSTTWGNVDYTYPMDGTAPITHVVSSSESDVDPLYVEGLDINGFKVIQVVILEGQTPVELSTPLWRVYRMSNLKITTGADRSIGYAGQVYCYESANTSIVAGVPDTPGAVKAFMNNGTNSTLQSPWTCPAGNTGYFIAVDLRSAKKQAAFTVIEAHIRNYAGVFRLVDIGSLTTSGTSNYTVQNYIPVAITEKSDVVITANADTVGMGVGLVYYILLFDNEIWGL